MPSDSISLSDRVTGSIQQLAVVATDLNKASDELGRAITAIDTVLQGLNLGIPTWVTIQGYSDPHENFWQRDVGYAKVSNRWGIALRTVEGNSNWPEDENCESWLFNDAPRWLRVEGVAKIPDLLEALIKNTEATTKKIRTKTAEANELAAVIAQAAKKQPASPILPGYSAPTAIAKAQAKSLARGKK
jgi:hypothetical protein